ncbi:MAG: hypothetical protein ACRCX8_11405 [Sarcina sp.]
MINIDYVNEKYNQANLDKDEIIDRFCPSCFEGELKELDCEVEECECEECWYLEMEGK